MSLADLARRIENLIRIGTIAEVDVADPKAPRVRVKDGELLTGWLPFGAMRAGTARVWSVPTVGEQVMVFSPCGDLASAVVFGSLYCAIDPAPSTDLHEHIIDFADGTRMSHNDETGAMAFTGMKTLLLKASESVTVDTPATNLNGTVTHVGAALRSNGVVLHTHTHGGVRGGSDKTGGPA
jgi:phage baseplate assembly protein V